MKRSEVNEIMRQAVRMIRRMGFVLPPFAQWSPEDFGRHPNRAWYAERRLGWEITDFGHGRFAETGLVSFALRNGALAELKNGGGMAYAEKLLISRKGQVSPLQGHRAKVKDLINRGGGTLVIELCGSDDQGHHDPDRGGTVLCDGIAREFGPYDRIALGAGESMTLRPGDWHAFWAEDGDVLIGEISTVSDEGTDRVFVDPVGRHALIEDDDAPNHLLVSDYENWLR